MWLARAALSASSVLAQGAGVAAPALTVQTRSMVNVSMFMAPARVLATSRQQCRARPPVTKPSAVRLCRVTRPARNVRRGQKVPHFPLPELGAAPDSGEESAMAASDSPRLEGQPEGGAELAGPSGGDQVAAATLTPPAEATAGGDGPPGPTTSQALYKFWMKWHLPIGLVVFVVFGFLVPVPGEWLGDNTELSTACVVIIFFFSGMKLKTDEVWTALRDWVGVITGLVLILGVTPLIGYAVREIPLGSDALSNGLALFFAMPTTISSGVVLTGQAKGSKALALFFSVSTNMLATLTAPLFLSLLLRGEGVGSGTIDIVGILWKLLLTVCLPLIVGKLCRWFDLVRKIGREYSDTIKQLSSLFLVLIPWMKVSQSAAQISSLSGGIIAAVFGVGAASHLVLLVLCAAFAAPLPLTNASRKAIIIMGSQKTVSIAVAFLALLPEAMSPGVMVIPCVISHFTQIVIDAFVATLLISLLPTAPAAEALDATATEELAPKGASQRGAASAAPTEVLQDSASPEDSEPARV